jgi:ATP-dependent Clp protease protease subunit
MTDLFIHGVDMAARKLYLMEEITPELASVLVPAIGRMAAQSPDPIELTICSPGGDVPSALAIHDAIRLSKAPVITIGTGEVCSAAVLLLASGRGRWATPTCWMMHHQMSIAGEGTETALNARNQANRKQATLLYNLLEQYTGKTAKFWRSAATRKGEFWLDAPGMKAHGIIDDIVQYS